MRLPFFHQLAIFIFMMLFALAACNRLPTDDAAATLRPTAAVEPTSQIDETQQTAAEFVQPANTVQASPATQPLSVFDEELQFPFKQTGTLAIDEPLTVTIPLAAAMRAYLLIATSTPISVTVIAPDEERSHPLIALTDEQLIATGLTPNPDTISAKVYQYPMTNPADGKWNIQLLAQHESDYGVFLAIESSIHLVTTPAGGTYHPGDPIVFQAILADGNAIIPGATMTGTLLLPDKTTMPLVFQDDGIHNNGVAVTQITAPDVNRLVTYQVRAVKDNLIRVAEEGFTIAGQTAIFQKVVGEIPVDTNGNGLYDELNLQVLLDIQQAGDYTIQGILTDASGNPTWSDDFSTFATGVPLPTGMQTITLSFLGKTLRDYAIDGPYVLEKLKISYMEPSAYTSVPIDSAEQLYTTAAYRAAQFEGALLQVLSSEEAAVDEDGDGLFERLTVSVTFDVLFPGEYSWFGILTSAPVIDAPTSGEGFLDSRTPAVFTFDGSAIRRMAHNGPYRLTNVYVTRKTGRVETLYFDDVHTTAAYEATEFAP